MKAQVIDFVRSAVIILAIVMLGIVLTNKPGATSQSEYTGERIRSSW